MIKHVCNFMTIIFYYIFSITLDFHWGNLSTNTRFTQYYKENNKKYLHNEKTMTPYSKYMDRFSLFIINVYSFIYRIIINCVYAFET